MPTPIPTKMSQFENVTSLSTASYIVGLDINGGELKNIKISGSAAGYELARKRWILNPPVTYSLDTRGHDGAESYSSDYGYWIKSGSFWIQLVNTGSEGTISSSAQLSDGGGFAFDISNDVTFGRVDAIWVTSSKLQVYEEASIGTNINHTHFITGSIYASSSVIRLDNAQIYGAGVTLSSNLSASKIVATANGTADAPAFTWASEPNTGIYRISSNEIGFVVGGAQFGTLSSAGGFKITGSLSGSISGISSSYATSASYVTSASYAKSASFVLTALSSTTSSYSLYAKDAFVFNVKDYGAAGDDSTDDTNAFNAAIAAIPASGGTLYIPAGTYLLTNLTAFSGKPIVVLGENRIATKLKSTIASGQMFSFSSMDGSIRNLTFTSNVARNELTPLITTTNCTFFQLENISSNASGDLIYSLGGNWFFATNVFIRSDAALGGIGIHSRGQSLIFNNVVLSNNNTANVVKYPVLWIEGTDSTGMKINNSAFSGGGPLYRYTGTSITSVADKFTIVFPSTHEFGINEYVVISGSGASQYHGSWKVAAKSSNTVVISSSLNLGSFSPNLVHSIPCNAVITNKYGAINESEMNAVMFEAVGYPVDALSCGLFIDGTKSNSNISGWKFNSCYFDYGKIGALAVGGGTTGYNTTTARLLFSSTQCETPYQGIAIQQVPGVIIDGLQGPMYLVNSDPGNCGIYLYSNPYGEGLRGIQISNCSLGGDQSWQERTIYTRDYGMIIDGNIDGLTLSNNIIWGLSGSVKLENNTTLGSSNIKSSNNLFYSGSADPSAAITIPSIASAATIELPWNDQIILTGTTTISTINGGWKSREVQFIVNSGLSFNTGGNIATSKAVSAGTVARLIYDGTNWRHFS